MKNKYYTAGTKCVAAIVLYIMCIVLFFGTMSIYALVEGEFYINPAASQALMVNAARGDAYELLRMVEEEKDEAAAKEYADSLGIGFSVKKDADIVYSYLPEGRGDESIVVTGGKSALSGYYTGDEKEADIYEITLRYDASGKVHNRFMLLSSFAKTLAALKYAIYPIMLVVFLLAGACFVFLMCSAGRTRDIAGIKPWLLSSLPLEIPSLLSALIIMGACYVVFRVESGTVLTVFLLAGGATVCFFTVLFYLMDLAVRFKIGRWWKNTLTYIVLKLLLRAIAAFIKAVGRFFSNLALAPFACAALGGICLIEFIGMAAASSSEQIMIMWFIEKLLLAVPCVWIVSSLKKLYKATEALSQGEIGYRTEEKGFWGIFKRAAANLNSLSQGMDRAVAEQMKSERMKTELITNVSHDIKTPLTSLISYSELISAETDIEKMKEYAQVVYRQSDKLKKLLSDLIEASRASSGDVEVNLTRCELGVLLSQISGEYSQKMSEKNLTLIVNEPENECFVMTDTRLIHRILDNLLSNVLKYSLCSTRVYAGIQEQGSEFMLYIKNTSASPLNVSADELMQRFVRGEASRTTEGSGLGLSIAKSLAEITGARLELSTNADLFTAAVVFKKA